MKKNKIIFPVTVLTVAVFITAVFLTMKHKKGKIDFPQDYVMAWELPELLSFTYYDAEEWERTVGKIAKGKLDYRELDKLLDRMGVSEYVAYKQEAGFKTVSRKNFFEIYRQLVDLLDVDSVVKAEELVFICEKDSNKNWITSRGIMTVKDAGRYISPRDMYRVYLLNGKIIGIEQRITKEVMWENVFIHSAGEGKLSVLYEKEHLNLELYELTDTITDTVCDLKWENGAVTAIYKKEDTIRGTVLSYDEKQIEIAGYGTLKHEGLNIYKTYGTVEQLDESKLMIGNLVADFVVARGRVCGIILTEPPEITDIRVLLLNKESPYYKDILLKADQAVTVTFGDDEAKIDTDTVIRASDYWKDGAEGYLKLKMVSEQGLLFLVNEKGEPISQGYQGSVEIRRYSKGYGIVNELSLEEYLCAVVPSEMPASYEMEALRAQAVCARSYACIHLNGGEYAEFGANVDDSTAYQVYNKQKRNERSTLAVRDTVGEVLKYKDAIAEAYFYSTSCGFSQNTDVWELSDGAKYEYLKSISLLKNQAEFDFSNEDVFASFIKDKTQTGYDSDMPYFRWQAGMKASGLKGEYSGMGEITGFVPVERSAGGVLKKLKIQFEKGTVVLTTEYNIRKVLGAAESFMKDKNDKDITAMTLLPSAAFVVEKTEDGFVFYGGGYGHGIGLSQNGANGMAKAGLTYVDILQKFYQNIKIENIYNNPEGF